MRILYMEIVKYDFFNITYDGIMTFYLMAIVFAFLHYFWAKNLKVENFFNLIMAVVLLLILAYIPIFLRWFYYYIKGIWFTSDEFYVIRSYQFVRSIFLGVLLEAVYQVMRYLFRQLRSEPKRKYA